jgi:hypothetical protein
MRRSVLLAVLVTYLVISFWPSLSLTNMMGKKKG